MIGDLKPLEFTMTLIQMPCEEGNREFNFMRARELLKDHKPSEGIDFIAVPELFAIGYRHEDYEREGPGVPGPTSEFLCEIAKEHGAYVFMEPMFSGRELKKVRRNTSTPWLLQNHQEK